MPQQIKDMHGYDIVVFNSSQSNTTPPPSCSQVTTPPVQNDGANRFYWITRNDVDEAIGNEVALVSFDTVESDNYNIADISIDNDGDVEIYAVNRGVVAQRIHFTYRGRRNNNCFSATLVVKMRVNADLSLEMLESQFIDTDDEPGEKDSGSWNWGSFLKGAAEFGGGFLAGYIGEKYGLFDDDD